MSHIYIVHDGRLLSEAIDSKYFPHFRLWKMVMNFLPSGSWSLFSQHQTTVASLTMLVP
jgi:hypothetical protein